jgi:hypothetical protein
MQTGKYKTSSAYAIALAIITDSIVEELYFRDEGYEK